MKKIILSLMVMFAAVSANAQVYVGGSLAWTHDEGFELLTNDDAAESNSFVFAPEIGYNITEKWAVGIELAYQHIKESGDDWKVKANAFAFAPYVRYAYFNKGIVRLFLDGGFGISTYKIKDYGDRENGFEVGIKPGVAIKATEHLSFEAKYGFLGYRDQYSLAGNKASVSGLDFNPNSLSIGIKYEF